MSLRKFPNFRVPCENINVESNIWHVPKRQKKFLSRVCCDKDMKLFSKSCKRLENLDLMMSAYVCDNFLNFILRSQYLQHLNMSRTRITQRGLTWILSSHCFTSGVGIENNFTSVFKQVVILRFNYTTLSHIYLLASKLQNIKSHRLSVACQNPHSPSKRFGILVKFDS
jgi:hypothetical protein